MINETMYARGAESSIIREIFSYGLERKAQIGAENVFDFSLGNPSVPAPAAVNESIKKSLELPSEQVHGYTPAPGLPACRAAVAESLNRRFGTSYAGKDVFMTVGAAASLTCTLTAITNPGDEVIVIAPYFPEYRVWIEKAGCTCVEVLADEETFRINVGNVARAITDKTAAIIIDSPNNPTGAVYTRDTLERLTSILREENKKRDPQNPIYLISDEPSDVDAYARNREALTGALGEYGYTYVEPDGAFYLWVKALEPDAEAFCERAKKYELLAVPSNSFGVPGWFRLGYCVSYETIQNSLPAWKALAEEYRAIE